MNHNSVGMKKVMRVNHEVNLPKIRIFLGDGGIGKTKPKKVSKMLLKQCYKIKKYIFNGFSTD